MRRIQSGQSGEMMTNRIAGQFGGAPYKYFGDWTDRIAKGELPKAKPPRPAGRRAQRRRHSWEWSTEKHYLHDLIASDRRNPTVNAYGPRLRLAGVLDRQHADPGSQDEQGHVLQDAGARPDMPVSLGPGHAAAIKPTAPSAYWGDEAIWDTRANNHNAMFDRQGRVWIAATVRGMDNPAFCKKGSDHPSAKVFPLDRSGAPGRGVRSEDEEVHVRRHLLRHPPSPVRL